MSRQNIKYLVSRVFEGAPEEAPQVEEVLTGNEEDGKESHGVR